jgi:hypothetical protein
MKANEHYELTGKQTCQKVLSENPTYKVYWTSGFRWKGARTQEDDKQPRTDFGKTRSFAERMEQRYDWAAAIDVDVLHDTQEIHFNGFSCNDLY